MSGNCALARARQIWGAHAPSRAGLGASPKRTFLGRSEEKKFALAGRPRQHARRVRSPEICAALRPIQVRPSTGAVRTWLGTSAFLLFALSGCRHPQSNKVQGYIEGEFVYVASPLAGALQKLHGQRGQQVNAGDPLFELDDVSERAARDQARAALTLSEKEFERQEDLFRSGASAAQDLDRARSARDQDRQRLTQAEWSFDQKNQSAPKTGLVFDTLFREGEWVPANRPVVSLLPPENVKLRAFVPETRVSQIHPGDQVRVFMDGASAPFVGKVSFVSPRAEYTPPVIYSNQSRSKLVFMVEAVFEPSIAVKLHPGQPVDVEFGS